MVFKQAAVSDNTLLMQLNDADLIYINQAQPPTPVSPWLPSPGRAAKPGRRLVALLHLADDLTLLVLCALLVGDGLVQQRIEAFTFRLNERQPFWSEISL